MSLSISDISCGIEDMSSYYYNYMTIYCPSCALVIGYCDYLGTLVISQ